MVTFFDLFINLGAISNVEVQRTRTAMNDTLGPEGLVPSAPVFGEYPKAYTRSKTPPPRSTLVERASIAKSVRKEMEKHMSEMRIKRALKHRPPAAADLVYQPGDSVLIWR